MRLEAITLQPDISVYRHTSQEVEQLLEMYTAFYPEIGYVEPWIGYFIVNEENVVVGSCSFIGKPINNEVEISYWTFKAFEGTGVASFACESLVSIARNAQEVIVITAKTEPTKNASTRILEKNGFTQVGTVQDHEIGDAWLWKLQS